MSFPMKGSLSGIFQSMMMKERERDDVLFFFSSNTTTLDHHALSLMRDDDNSKGYSVSYSHRAYSSLPQMIQLVQASQRRLPSLCRLGKGGDTMERVFKPVMLVRSARIIGKPCVLREREEGGGDFWEGEDGGADSSLSGPIPHHHW